MATGRLGCGINEAFITGKGGSPRIMSLLGADDISWSRQLDDTSEAQVVIRNNADCCDVIGDVEPWCHELHIKRGDDTVWVGPVVEVLYSFDTVTINARDVTVWMTKRVAEVDIDNEGSPLDIVDIAQNVLNVAFAEDDPGVLPYVASSPSGLVTERKFLAYTDTAYNQLEALADTGLNYTVVGRTVVLGGENLPLSQIATLRDEHILSDVTLTKSGLLQGNRYFVHFDEDGNLPAIADVDKQCYGLLEVVRPNNDSLPTLENAQQVADVYVSRVGTAPRLLDMGGNARLSPETPWTIQDMIPGARVSVSLTRLCIDVFRSFRLTGVFVKQGISGEEISIQLGDINAVTGNL